MFTGLEIPDPITFVIGTQWLRKEILYPRQATLLKIFFLRNDLLTEYDHAVIDEWEENYRSTGNNGITPGVRQRMEYLRANGYKWFREILLVMGRRAGKGQVAALGMSYVLWNYMAKGNPQKHYGIAPRKKLDCLIYAGKKEQARKNLWQDLVDNIIDGPCFQPYISRVLGETVTVFAPYDKVRMRERARSGTFVDADQATFRIEPKEATLMSGRGITGFMMGFDEMAHTVASGANRSAEEIFTAATPSLDQFKKDAFIIEPSSPWQMTGQFYQNYQNSLEMVKDEYDNDTDVPMYPTMMMVQLTSWDIYKDWEIAHEIELFPRDFQGDLDEYLTRPLPRLFKLDKAIQEYDDQMRLLERSNPDTFKVERMSHWQATMDAYLDPDKIKAMFNNDLEMTTKGKLNRYYKGHADPSSSNANFGLAIAHTEEDPNGSGFKICVFDYIHHWDPAEYEDHSLDYVTLMDELWDIIAGFPVDDFTVDQFNAGPILSILQNKARNANSFKRIQIGQDAVTAKSNWVYAENFKVALNQGWVKAPYYEQAELELKFLKLVMTATTNRVDKQDTGPVRTKDVADAMFACVMHLIGDQVESMKAGLAHNPIGMGVQGGIVPFGNISPEDEKIFQALGGGAAGRLQGSGVRNGSYAPSRSGRIYKDAGYRRSF